mgnify:CR=1 FL=1
MKGRWLLALSLSVTLMAPAEAASRDLMRPPEAAPVTAKPPARTPALGSSDVLAVYPDRIVVIDPSSPDDWGVIPVKGMVHSAIWLMERHLLLVHLPEQKTMAVIDTRPGSVTRYTAIASYQAPEFADASLRFAVSSGRVYLARDHQAVLIFDPKSLLAKIGLYSVDFLPVVYSTLTRVILSDRILALEEGQLTVEWTRPRPGEVAAPRYVRLPYRPTGMLSHREGGLVFLSCRADDGSGRILALNAETLEVVREVTVPHAITSMAWLDDGRLCVLSAAQSRFAILDVKAGTWTRVWTPKIPGRPVRLLSAAPPPLPEFARDDIGFGEVYEP